MAKLEKPFVAEPLRLIADAIDRNRRDAVQRRNAARGEATEMYYEGMRAALAEVQSFVEKVERI